MNVTVNENKATLQGRMTDWVLVAGLSSIVSCGLMLTLALDVGIPFRLSPALTVTAVSAMLFVALGLCFFLAGLHGESGRWQLALMTVAGFIQSSALLALNPFLDSAEIIGLTARYYSTLTMLLAIVLAVFSLVSLFANLLWAAVAMQPNGRFTSTS